MAGFLFTVCFFVISGAVTLVTSSSLLWEFRLAQALFAIGAGTLLATFLFWQKRQSERPASSVLLTWVAGCIAISGAFACLIGGLLWVDVREGFVLKPLNASSATTAPILDNQIKYDCDVAHLPETWPDGVSALQVIGPPEPNIDARSYAMYMGFVSGSKPVEFSKTFEGSTFECTITNYSLVPITSFKAMFTLAWLTIKKNGDSLTSGHVINFNTIETPNFQLGTTTHQTASFFVVNESKTLVTFTMPTTAEIKIAGSDTSQLVKLLRNENDFTGRSVWPLEQYLKGLQSAPLLTPTPPPQPRKK